MRHMLLVALATFIVVLAAGCDGQPIPKPGQQEQLRPIMSEGVRGASAVRTALQIYYSQHGSYDGATMSNLQIGPTDLEGKYFAQTDYSLLDVTATTYTIKAGPPSKTTRTGMPYFTVDQNGAEHGTYYSN